MTIARGGAGRAVLVVIVARSCRSLVLAVVRIPNSDNHVRYVIETLPLAAHRDPVRRGDARAPAGLARAPSPPRSPPPRSSCAVEATRGARLPDYRYRGELWAQQKADLGRAAGYLRTNFARNDLFLGYDEAFATGVLAPGRQRRRSRRRAAPARSEPALIVRSLKRLHGPIAHGWYVALRGTSDARYERFRAALGGRLRGGDVRDVVRARAHARARADARRPSPAPACACSRRPQELSAPARAPSEQAAVTAEALRGALPDLR